jgi:hypothetical protein
MKIAILISGHIRSQEFAENNVRRLKSAFPQSDIFIHTWSINEMDQQTHHMPKFRRSPITEDNLINMLACKHRIEHQQDVKIPPLVSHYIAELAPNMQGAATGFYWMIYGINQATCLMNENESKINQNYDYVLRWRFDLDVDCYNLLQKDFSYLHFHNSTIKIPSSNEWWPIGTYSDVAWLMARNNHCIFNKLTQQCLAREIEKFRNSRRFLPELIVTRLMRRVGCQLIDFSCFFRLARTNHSQDISRKAPSIGQWVDRLFWCCDMLEVNKYYGRIDSSANADTVLFEWKRHSPLAFHSIAFANILRKMWHKIYWRFNCRRLNKTK